MEKYFCFYTKDNKALIYMTQTQINKAIKLWKHILILKPVKELKRSMN
jgi:hypothetical protein